MAVIIDVKAGGDGKRTVVDLLCREQESNALIDAFDMKSYIIVTTPTSVTTNGLGVIEAGRDRRIAVSPTTHRCIVSEPENTVVKQAFTIAYKAASAVTREAMETMTDYVIVSIISIAWEDTTTEIRDGVIKALSGE